jgi:hypothetical protein
MRNAVLGTAVLLAFSATVSAQFSVTATPAPYTQLIGGSPGPSGSEPLYVNTLDVGYFFPAGAGVAVADDLQMASLGIVTGFDFAYYDSGPSGFTDAEVRFYENGPLPSQLIASFGLYGLMTDPTTAFAVSTDLTGTGYEFAASRDIVMEISFSSPTAGWLLADPPVVGESRDLFWIDGEGPYWFDGDPRANFLAEIYSVPEPAGPAALAAGLIGLASLRRRRA